MITTIYSKPSIYGGRQFVIYNDITKKYADGNTASTAISHHHADIQLNGVLLKELKQLKRRLELNGYTEHAIRWAKDIDTYKEIHNNLLINSRFETE